MVDEVGDGLFGAVGSGLAKLIVLAEQLNGNRVFSYSECGEKEGGATAGGGGFDSYCVVRVADSMRNGRWAVECELGTDGHWMKVADRYRMVAGLLGASWGQMGRECWCADRWAGKNYWERVGDRWAGGAGVRTNGHGGVTGCELGTNEVGGWMRRGEWGLMEIEVMREYGRWPDFREKRRRDLGVGWRLAQEEAVAAGEKLGGSADFGEGFQGTGGSSSMVWPWIEGGRW
ncbi:hypothetical protein NE237_019383 [Protea cynaroides]|uniref:Uncharacterized protein n=1 Tax=Protea cynaroides TaxID=273540 RepID=A0A9Q0KBS0_9MAGN|nr:hypothetical protein NE237_019383 [Protea cynaroides]